MGMRTDASEIRRFRPVTEFGGAPWSGTETIMKANFSIWSQKFYHHKDLWKGGESYLVNFQYANYLALCIALIGTQCS